MKILSTIRNEFIQGRIYLVRGVAYLSLVNAGMILFLFLDKLKELGIISWDINQYFFPLLIAGFLMLLIIGWFEIKVLKGIQKEGQINFSYTPQFPNMEKKINEIYVHLIGKSDAEPEPERKIDSKRKPNLKDAPSISCAGMRRIA